MSRYPLVWYWTESARPALGDRKGQRCRVLARAKPARDENGDICRRWNTAMVEFDDGHVTITSGNALRKP